MAIKNELCPLQTKYYAVLVMRVTLKSSGGGKGEGRSRKEGKDFPTIVLSVI